MEADGALTPRGRAAGHSRKQAARQAISGDWTDEVAGEAGKLKKMLEGERGRQGPREHPNTELRGSCWSAAR